MIALKHTQTLQQNSGISEIIMPQRQNDSLELLLPMLAHLSRQTDERWMTWIAAPQLSKALVTHYGFNLNKVRLMHSQSDEESLWLSWEALNNGTSAYVVTHLQQAHTFHAKERGQLEVAANYGYSRGLIIK